MAVSVTASDLLKDFGLWHERSMAEPVQITRDGRESAYLVSAETFHELWANFRRSVAVRDLSEAEMALIAVAEVPADRAYEMDDLPAPGADGPTDPPRA